VAEQYGAATGLGYLSSVAAQRFQMAAMFVPIVLIAALGAAPAALADPGMTMSPTGWASLFAIPVIVGVLWVVHKKIG